MAMRRICLGVTAALLLLIGIGCQSSGSSGSTAMGTPKHAVVISGGNGGGTVIYLPTDDPSRPMMMSTSGEEECADCKAAAVKYFETGTLEPKCSHCGATRSLTTATMPQVSHN